MNKEGYLEQLIIAQLEILMLKMELMSIIQFLIQMTNSIIVQRT